jgi:hypothetical protein
VAPFEPEDIELAPLVDEPVRRVQSRLSSPLQLPGEEPEQNFANWMRSRPKWFWIVLVVVFCVLGGLWQVYVSPAWRGRQYDELQRRKQQQTQATKQGEPRDGTSPGGAPADAERDAANEPVGN